MLFKLGFVLLLSSLLVVSRGLDEIPPEPPIKPTEPPANSTTAKPTTTTATTAKPTTTTASTTSTSSIAPPTNKTTSPPTSTSTQVVPTTSVAPTTVAPATVGKWRVKENNITCIIADLAIQVDVTFDINKTDHFIFDVPSNASVVNTSTCGNNSQSLVLMWEAEEKPLLTFLFELNGTNFLLSNIVLNLTKNATELLFHNEEAEFRTPVSKSYRCAKSQAIKLIESGNKAIIAELKINSVQLEAFHKKTDDNFSAAEDCAGSSSPDIVPIAVGCALVGLVAVVLIAYLVGRRRSQARGYLSM